MAEQRKQRRIIVRHGIQQHLGNHARKIKTGMSQRRQRISEKQHCKTDLGRAPGPHQPVNAECRRQIQRRRKRRRQHAPQQPLGRAGLHQHGKIRRLAQLRRQRLRKQGITFRRLHKSDQQHIGNAPAHRRCNSRPKQQRKSGNSGFRRPNPNGCFILILHIMESCRGILDNEIDY